MGFQWKRQNEMRWKRAGGFGLFLLLLTVMFLNPFRSYAADEERVLRVGYYQSRGFQEGMRDDAPKSGYGYEYLQRVAVYTGWKYEYVYGSWDDLYQMLLDGKIDLMAAVARDKGRSHRLGYPDYEMLSENIYIYKDSDDASMKCGEFSSYNGKRVGINIADEKMNFWLEHWIGETGAQITVVPYETMEACAEGFNEKKIDAFVSAENIVSSYAGITPVEKIGREPYYLCVTGKHPEFLDELNMALSLMEEQDALYLDELKNRYSAESSVTVFLSRQEREWMDRNDTITVGYLDHYLPYCDTETDGTVTGMLSDLMPDLLAALPGDYAPNVIYRPYEDQKELQESLKDGTTDVIFPVSGEAWYAEQEAYQQSSNVVTSRVDLVYRDPYTDKTTARIAINKNNQLQYYYTIMNFPDAEVVLCEDSETCVEAVKNGKAGSTVVSAFRVHYLVGPEKQLNVSPLAKAENSCFGVAFGNTALLRLLNHGLSILGDSYGLDHTYQYSAQLKVYTFSDFVQDHALAFAAGMCAILIGVVLFFLHRENRQLKIAEKEARQKQELEAALSAAEEASRARTVFLRNMSHDIRTPMNAILGFANLAVKAGEDWKKVQEYLLKILVSGNHLLAIVNDVLEISRIESGKTHLNEAPCSIPEVVGEAEVIIREQALEKRQAFTVDLSAVTDPYVVCDKLRIREILVNLLGNAVKFTPEGGRIALWIVQKPDPEPGYAGFEMHVTDNGCGMNKAFLEKVFEPFAREQNSTVSGIQGTGLGLAITKHFVDLMGGTIEIRSEEGKGTEVVIFLRHPLAGADEIPDEDITEKTEREPVNFTGMRILLAEDNELNREIASAILEDAGFVMETAENGKEAVEKLQASEAGYYAAVLMDLQMPVMDGYEAVRQIRNLPHPALSGIPVIAVSANAFEEDKNASLAAGMNAHIAKPIQVPVLLETLKNILA